MSHKTRLKKINKKIFLFKINSLALFYRYKTNDIYIMALSNLGGVNTTYLSVADGNLVRQHKQANERTTERLTKTGKLVFEERFKDLTAKLDGITTRENDYGKQWQLRFQDQGDYYVISLPFSSRYASSFLKVLPNIDLSKEIRFMPWAMKDKMDATKTITGITLYQDGEKVAPYYTKEDPKGLPQMVKIKVKGKEQWDDSDMMTFLEEMALNLFEQDHKDLTTASSDNDEVPF